MVALALSTRDPALAIGQPIDTLDTPALVLDLDVVEANIARTVEIARAAGARLRPHIKTHRMLAVARLQIDAGARGICCAKTGEAEVFADGGIDDIFIANQVVGTAKMRRLRALAERVRLAVGVDHPEQIELLSQAFGGADPLDISIEIDVGQRRTGVVEPHEAAELAQRILDSPGLALRGVYTHEGHDYAARDDADLAVIADQAQRQMLEAAQAIRDATGAPCEVSMGSTPSLFARKFLAGIDELRPGTAVFNDGSHANFLGHTDWCAATVLATVVNRPARDRVVVDAGAKALTSDRRGPSILENSGFGMVIGRPDATIVSLSDEHGVLSVPDAGAYTIGEVIRIIPNHICPCVNLYDHAFVAREGIVQDIWEVSARGQSQ
ncbi:MAG: alanine racemase [Chloroflexota bacterium]|nr:alanine racemase [Chloroflexota bacterium]